MYLLGVSFNLLRLQSTIWTLIYSTTLLFIRGPSTHFVNLQYQCVTDYWIPIRCR